MQSMLMNIRTDPVSDVKQSKHVYPYVQTIAKIYHDDDNIPTAVYICISHKYIIILLCINSTLMG